MPQPTNARGWELPAAMVIPSWLLSLLLHVAVILPLAWTFQNQALPGKPEEVRAVGLVSENPTPTDAQAVGQAEAVDAEEVTLNHKPPAAVALPDAPPVNLQVPTATAGPARLGPGPIKPVTGGSQIKPSRAMVGETGQAGGGSVARFFGVEAKGVRIVYLIDSSSSMSSRNAIGVARAELMASLQPLEEHQQFQVIFYDTSVHPWIREGRPEKIYYATDIHKNLVANFIRQQQPSGGTRHMLGLDAALKLDPDVIFFLTDAREPEPSLADLDAIRRRCQGRCTIHTIEFGVGERIRTDNFLEKLARFTNGTSAYRNVMQFVGK